VGDGTATRALARLGLIATAAQSIMMSMITPMRRVIRKFRVVLGRVAVELEFMTVYFPIILQQL
jgi:hypothetical protein